MMTTTTNEKKWNLLLHLVGGLIFLLFPFFTSPDFPHFPRMLHNPLGLRDLATGILLLVFFYLHLNILIPKFLFQNNYLIYVLCIIASIGISVVLPAIIPATLHQGPPPIHHAGHPPFGPPHHGLLQRLLFNHHLYLFVFVFFFSLLLSINNRWKKLRQEKIQTELLFLKAQINPHFLFNTFNSVYSLCIEEKAQQSASAVLKVSGMMRYVLIESKNDYVDIEKEITYIQDYIELQRLRFGNTVNIHFTLNGNFTGKKIAPLVLIAFIENAFKYGINPEQDSTISIDLMLQEDQFALKVVNNKVAPTGNNQQMGIGISTTLKRLQLLYPASHQVKINDENNIYQVLLYLTLS